MIWILLIGGALARSWCAAPVVVHEWGVQVFTDSEPQHVDELLPSWFYRGPGLGSADPVKSLPADGGIRRLPVLQIYSPSELPIGVEASFSGAITSWYPQLDRFTETSLAWDSANATVDSRSEPRPATQAWVNDLRQVQGAMWVNRGSESERFFYYEADTQEKPLLEIQGDLLVNTGKYTAYDIVVVRDAQLEMIEKIEAGASHELHLVAVRGLEQSGRHFIRTQLGVPDDREALQQWMMGNEDCVMERDPAVPFTQPEGHGLYPDELQVVLDLWSSRIFQNDKTVILYRDGIEALVEQAPLAIYTDMSHYIKLRRTGLVLSESQ